MVALRGTTASLPPRPWRKRWLPLCKVKNSWCCPTRRWRSTTATKARTTNAGSAACKKCTPATPRAAKPGWGRRRCSLPLFADVVFFQDGGQGAVGFDGFVTRVEGVNDGLVVGVLEAGGGVQRVAGQGLFGELNLVQHFGVVFADDGLGYDFIFQGEVDALANQLLDIGEDVHNLFTGEGGAAEKDIAIAIAPDG